MRAVDVLKSPLYAAELFTGAKSFVDNPILGSRALNERGLHVRRIELAERMADARRRRLRRLVSEADAAAYDRDGFIVRENFLPPEDFRRLADEVEGTAFPATEMKQGNAVTRFIPLGPKALGRAPRLAQVARGAEFLNLLRYVASAQGDPSLYLHTVITDPGRGRPDPQTAFHADTFHATAKAWLFLRDVALEEGPFSFVPGSHRLTPARIAWERAQSLTAADGPDRLHGRGSFRATAEQLQDMGYPAPRTFEVPANTLVVADTHGFHARAPSLRPSTRVALYGSLRRNPFLPWTGFDLWSAPGLKGRRTDAFHALLDLRERATGRKSPQPWVGEVRPGDPARR